MALKEVFYLNCFSQSCYRNMQRFSVFGNGSAIDIELLGNLANRQALMMKTARLNNGFHVNHSQDSSAKNGEFSNNQGGALLSAHTLISWCSFTCALTARY